MTNDELRAMRARATPGPWKVGMMFGELDGSIYAEDPRIIPSLADNVEEDTAALIVAAVNALPRLLAEHDKMREALQRIESAPAWGAPDKWETTPAEVRQIARAALEPKP